MTRDDIIELIRSTYDPVPRDWPRHRCNDWDDGAEDIADKILNSMAVKPPTVEECPLCKLKASTMLHKFCMRGECPVR